MLTLLLLIGFVLTVLFPEKIMEMNIDISVYICFFGFLISGILSYNLDINKRIETIINSIIYSMFNIESDNDNTNSDEDDEK